jgi:hypothetical protein
MLRVYRHSSGCVGSTVVAALLTRPEVLRVTRRWFDRLSARRASGRPRQPSLWRKLRQLRSCRRRPKLVLQLIGTPAVRDAQRTPGPRRAAVGFAAPLEPLKESTSGFELPFRY